MVPCFAVSSQSGRILVVSCGYLDEPYATALRDHVIIEVDRNSRKKEG